MENLKILCNLSDRKKESISCKEYEKLKQECALDVNKNNPSCVGYDPGWSTEIKLIVGIIIVLVISTIIFLLWWFFWPTKFTRANATYVSDPVTDATSIKYVVQPDRIECEKVCEADPKCKGYTWFDTTTDFPKRCVGIPGEPHLVVPSTHHFSGIRN